MTRKLIDSLYVEAMVLADEARAYFDLMSTDQRSALDPVMRVAFSCESLKVTTRLMHVIAWLLTHRAIADGEMEPERALRPSLRLGVAADSEPDVLGQLPQMAQEIIGTSLQLYRRVQRLDAQLSPDPTPFNPAKALHHRLERAF
jgi:regulator of CtrA degradation